MQSETAHVVTIDSSDSEEEEKELLDTKINTVSSLLQKVKTKIQEFDLLDVPVNKDDEKTFLRLQLLTEQLRKRYNETSTRFEKLVGGRTNTNPKQIFILQERKKKPSKYAERRAKIVPVLNKYMKGKADVPHSSEIVEIIDTLFPNENDGKKKKRAKWIPDIANQLLKEMNHIAKRHRAKKFKEELAKYGFTNEPDPAETSPTLANRFKVSSKVADVMEVEDETIDPSILLDEEDEQEDELPRSPMNSQNELPSSSVAEADGGYEELAQENSQGDSSDDEVKIVFEKITRIH